MLVGYSTAAGRDTSAAASLQPISRRAAPQALMAVVLRSIRTGAGRGKLSGQVHKPLESLKDNVFWVHALGMVHQVTLHLHSALSCPSTFMTA